jgi:hypothetical protein
MPYDDDSDDFSHLPTVDSAHDGEARKIWKKHRQDRPRVEVPAAEEVATHEEVAPEPATSAEAAAQESAPAQVEWHEPAPEPPVEYVIEYDDHSGARWDHVSESETRLVPASRRGSEPAAAPIRAVLKPAVPPRIQPITPPAEPQVGEEIESPPAEAGDEPVHVPEEEKTPEPEVPKAMATSSTGEVEEAPPADNSQNILSAKKRAWITAAAAHLGILLLLAIVQVVPMDFKRPEIVALTEVDMPENVDWKKVTQAAPQTSAMASISPITSTGISDVAMPAVDFTSTANELNVGSSFGTFGAGAGMGGNVSFMGNSGRGRHVVFVVDVSGSMSAIGKPKSGDPISRFDLLKKELIKSLSTMPMGTQYQILFFSDFAWPHNVVSSQDLAAFDRYKWEIQPDNINVNIPRFPWLNASSSTLNRSKKIIQDADNPGGTNWGSGLLMALRGTPKPDVIFFMTDGNENDEQGWVDVITRANGGKFTTIHTTAMMEPSGAEPLARLAALNKGKFTIVMPNGEIVKGDDFFARKPD